MQRVARVGGLRVLRPRLEPVAHVRTLGLVELVFSYAVSRRLFLEKLSRTELAGVALIAAGVAVIVLA